MKIFSVKLMWALTIIYLVATGFALQFLPDEVPMHFDFEGNITRYGSKYEMLLFPTIVVSMNAVFHFMIRNLRRKAIAITDERTLLTLRQNERLVCFFGALNPLIFAGINISIFVAVFSNVDTAVGNEANNNIVLFVLNVVLSLVIIIVGNFTPKMKRNIAMGVRTPWTLKNDVVWEKTNRLVGKHFVVIGLLILVINLISSTVAIYTCLVLVTLEIIIAMVYSKRLFDSLTKNSHLT